MKAEIISSIRKRRLDQRANSPIDITPLRQKMVLALWWALPLLTHRLLDRWQ